MFFSANNKSMSENSKIAVLDGVRAFACLSVVIFHISNTSQNEHILNLEKLGPIASSFLLAGGSGVTLFFVLSGFLLFMPYAKALLFDKPWPKAGEFYLKRVLRIIPGYYVALLVIVLLQQQQYLQPAHWKELGLFLTFLMDATPATYQKLSGPFWTLAIEWQFYMLLPLLALAFRGIVLRIPRQKRWLALVGCLVGMLLWGVATRFWGAYYIANPTETLLVSRPALQVILFFVYGMAGKFLEDFAVGMLLSMLFVLSRQASSNHPLSKCLGRASQWLWGLGLLWLSFLALWHFHNWFRLSMLFFSPVDTFYTPLSELLLALGFGLCIAALLFGSDYLRKPLEWRPMRWIGSISYSMYIWHLTILILYFQYVLKPLLEKGINHSILYGLFLLYIPLLVLPFSYIMYVIVESPGIRLSAALYKKKVQPQEPLVMEAAEVTPQQEVVTGRRW